MDRGVRGVVEFMLDNLANEACVKRALMELEKMTAYLKGEALCNASKRIIAKAMQDYYTEWDVQVWALQIYNNVVVQGE